jgi:transposase
MVANANAEVIVGHDFVGRMGFRRSRSGKRLWTKELKAQIVRESLAHGARVADVARNHGLSSQQLARWRRAARVGRFSSVIDAPAEFAKIEIEEQASRHEANAKIEIVVGKVVLRLDGDTASTRIAEIVTALERGA